MSIIKTITKDFLEHRGWYLRKTGGLPAGVDLFLDLSRITPEPLRTIFDVGAHHGETAEAFTRRFPSAAIYSFEPVAANFAVLSTNARALHNVKCLQTALGESEAVQKIELRGDSQTHSLRHTAGPAGGDSRGYEEVRVSTVDLIMQRERIEIVSLLKIDSEGYEIPVLKGAATALAGGRIRFILLEASLDPGDRTHSPLIELQSHLAGSGYSLVALYDQVIWPNPSRLAYFNALFARQSTVA
jgi:FkbM family methyltransferase